MSLTIVALQCSSYEGRERQSYERLPFTAELDVSSMLLPIAGGQHMAAGKHIAYDLLCHQQAKKFERKESKHCCWS